MVRRLRVASLERQDHGEPIAREVLLGDTAQSRPQDVRRLTVRGNDQQMVDAPEIGQTSGGAEPVERLGASHPPVGDHHPDTE